jgi:hypothetical protein
LQLAVRKLARCLVCRRALFAQEFLVSIRFPFVCGASLALVPIASAGILEVGPLGSGAPFTSVAVAVNTAAPGDTILVQPGIHTLIGSTELLQGLATSPSGLVSFSASAWITLF